MLPAIELDGHVITESDEILAVLESQFGPLGVPMKSITPLRQLERNLFRAWCQWGCYPAYSEAEENQSKVMFQQVLAEVDRALNSRTLFPERVFYSRCDLYSVCRTNAGI